MQFYTSEQRDEFIESAIHSKEMRGDMGVYNFRVIPVVKGQTTTEEDPLKENATIALASLTLSPKFRKLALSFVTVLERFIEGDVYLRNHVDDIKLVLKGGTAYALAIEPDSHPDLPFSDIDIAVNINPNLQKDVFASIYTEVRRVIFRALSHHKKMIDTGIALPPTVWEEYKEAHVEKMRESGFISPFVNTRVRNDCSRHSFILVKSNVHEDRVVNIEVPHFKHCHTIPLRKSPIFCSHNSTINFGGRSFELFRMRQVVMCEEMRADGGIKMKIDVDTGTGTDTDNALRVHLYPRMRRNIFRVTLDFIDVSVPNQHDPELQDFWDRGHVVEKRLDVPTGLVIPLPPVTSCIHDLEMMLNVYECPKGKRGKREKKLEALMQFLK